MNCTLLSGSGQKLRLVILAVFTFATTLAAIEQEIPELRDTAEINRLASQCKGLTRSYPDSALALAERILAASDKQAYKYGQASGWFLIASAYNNKSHYHRVIDAGKKAMALFEELRDTVKLVAAMNMIAIAYEFTGIHELSARMAWSALKLAESTQDSAGMANTWLSLGHIIGNTDMGRDQSIQWKKSLEYYHKGLLIAERLRNKHLMQRAWSLMANIYLFSGEEYDNNKDSLYKALHYYKKAIQVSEESGDIRGQVSPLNNSIHIYQLLGKVDTAGFLIKELYRKALASGSAYPLAFAHSAMAELCKEQGDLKMEAEHLEKSYENATRSGISDILCSSLRALVNYHSNSGDYKKANEYLEKLLKERIDHYNRTNPLDLIRLHAEAEHKREEEIQRMQVENERSLAASEARRKNIILIGTGAVLLLVLCFAVILFKRYRVTREQKNIIQDQKIILEEKQKEILDSIRYAKRIQSSLLPSDKLIERSMKQVR